MNGEIFCIADAAAFVAAIDKELDDTARENVAKVRKGRIAQREADYVVSLLRDIRSDLVHAFGPLPLGATLERADPHRPWRAKVRWISAELELRRADYPELVAKGRLLERDAATKLKMLETLHRLYWRELFMWEPDPGPALDFLVEIRRRKISDSDELDRAVPHGRAEYLELARKHFAALELEGDQAQGRLVA